MRPDQQPALPQSFSGVLRQSMVLVPALLLARIADLAKFIVIAKAFGASPAMDAFWIASSVPAGLGGLIESTAEQGFVVLGTRARVDKPGSEWTLQAYLILLALLGFGAVSVLYIFAADHMVALIGPGLGPPSRQTAGRLAQLLSPILLLSPIFGLLTGLHYLRQRYLLRTLVPVGGLLAVVLCLWRLRSRLGIDSLAVAYSAAYAVQLALLLPLFFRLRTQRTPLPYPLSHYRAKVTCFVFPMLLVSLSANTNLVAGRLVASFLPAGAISYLDYANRLGAMFTNLMVGGFLMAFYPFIAQQAASFDRVTVAREVDKALRAIALLMIPCLAFAAWLRVPMIRILFERGAFSHADTIATGMAFAAAAPGLLFLAFNTVLIRGYYSLNDSRIPMRISLVTIVPNLLLAIVLSHYWSFAGIAFSASVVNALAFVVFAVLFHRRHAELKLRALTGRGFRMLLAAAVSVVIVQSGFEQFAPHGVLRNAGIAWQAVAVLLAAGLYLIALWWFGVSDARRLVEWVLAPKLASAQAAGEIRR